MKIPSGLQKAAVAVFVLTVIWIVLVCCQMGENTEKLWLHRTNSLEKMEEKEARFPNFEVDLVYREATRTFDVTHDADTTFHLSLDAYLHSIKADSDSVWLDIKNLNEHNAEAARERLEQLCCKYGIPRRHFIVETRNINALECFTQHGFYTSYYVDFPKPSKLSDVAIDTCIAHLQRVADSKKVCALSFAGWWYIPIREKLNRDIDLLTWKHRTTEFGMLFFPHNRRMLNDKQLKVILVKSPSSYHR